MRVTAGAEGDGFREDWAGSRSGARAARGFHFQDAVGAWIAARIADGTMDGALVPEGLDDMTVEAASATDVQIKSRVFRLGPFTPALAARRIVDAWTASQGKSDPAALVWVVLENGVDTGEPLLDPQRALRDSLIPDSPLENALRAAASERLTAAQAEDLLGRTVALGLSWAQLDELTDAHLANRTQAAREGRAIVATALRIEVANATDVNENPDPSQRAALDRTAIIRRINATTEQIDVGALDAALRDGICAVLDWAVKADHGDRFYEGVPAQPGHVASGLVVPRADLIDEVLAGLEADLPVVVTGPSGIGKSAQLWCVPQALRGVTWFRVLRLQGESDANLILRLARAHGASPAHPVGFLVDGAGAGLLTRWDALRAAAAAQDGVLLLASARTEDLPALGGLAGTATVAVSLDEDSAAAIFNGLKRRGATTAPHWREAFEQARGLTLEFTHLLTQGRRLSEVIGDQVGRRIGEGRVQELEILALVAVAGQWSATLGLDQVSASLGAAPLQLRGAVARLANEHLLIEVDGVLSGLHPVRSAAIADAIHGSPPPALGSTLARVLELIDDRQMPRFIAQALREHPELEEVVLAAAGKAPRTAERLAGFLQGLRLADSEKVIRAWIAVMDEEEVKPSTRQTVVMLALAGTDMGELTPSGIRAALRRMAGIKPRGLRDELADRIGPDVISRLVFDSGPAAATELVATLHGWPRRLPVPAGPEGAPLIRHLAGAPLETLAGTLSTLEAHDTALQESVVALLGGEQRMLEAIREERPWILELDVRPGPGGPVGFARLLHVDDERQGDPGERCVELARVLLRLLPSIVKTDIEALLAGRRSHEIDGHVFGMSGLSRENDASWTQIAWNQARQATARALLGTPDTVRLSRAYPILRDAAEFAREAGTRWARGELTPQRAASLSWEAGRLREAAAQTAPSLGQPAANPMAISGGTAPRLAEPLSLAVASVAELFSRLAAGGDQRVVAAYARDTVQGHARDCLQEPWHLIEEGDRAVECINQIIGDAQSIGEVLAAVSPGDAGSRELRWAARDGAARYALRRGAEAARRARRDAMEGRRGSVARCVAGVVPGSAPDVRADERDGYTRYAVLVSVPTLLAWGEIEAPIIEALLGCREATEKFLILPIRDGKRVEGIGVSLIASPLPARDVAEWRPLLPDAHPAVIASLVSTAMEALQVLSGVTDLTAGQRRHPDVTAIVVAAGQRLSDAISGLQEHRDDEFARLALTEIRGIASRVRAEHEDPGSAITFAAAVSPGLTGVSTAERDMVAVMCACAVEWEICPANVRGLLNL